MVYTKCACPEYHFFFGNLIVHAQHTIFYEQIIVHVQNAPGMGYPPGVGSPPSVGYPPGVGYPPDVGSNVGSQRASQSSLKAPPDPPTGSPRASPSYATLWGGSRGVRARFDRKNMWFSHNLEFVTDSTGAMGAGEVVARPAARTPHPTRAGGQDDGSYTNSLK